MRVSFSVPRIRSACAVGLLVLSQQAARSQAAPQIQTPVQELSAKPPTLRQTTIPDAFVDIPFHASVQAADGYGDVAMTLRGALPAGLAMQSGARTLAISGVPEVSGTFDLEVTATDSKGQIARGSFTMRILPRPLANPPTAVIADPEVLHTTDADNVFFPAVIKDTEALHTTDVENVFFPAVIKDTETIATSDTENVFFPAVIKVAEGIKSTDADNSFFGAVITDPEAITTKDANVITAKVGILPSTTPSGTYNTAYSQAFTAAGNTGTVTLTPSGTIPGLSFSTSGTSSTTTLSGAPTTPGTYSFSITAKDTVNTDVVSYSLTINKASQTINVGTLPTPTYGGSAFSLTGDITATSGLTPAIGLSSGPVTGSGFGPYAITGAGAVSFTATQAGNADYSTASPVNFNVTIAKATADVAVPGFSRAFDQPNPTFTYSLVGFVNGDTASVASGAPIISTAATPLSPVSSSPYAINIALGTLTAANYNFGFAAGGLTVTKAAQTVTFYPLPTLSNGASFPLSARASSGLAVTYSVSGPASISNNILIVSGSGLVQVTASQTGGTNYNAATPVIRSFTAP